MENKKKQNNKGFSLVELIIVIAIMGILVGVVGTQVVPYMERSREAKDQQVLSSVATAVTSAVAMSGKSVEGFKNVPLSELDTYSSDKYKDLSVQIATLLLPESENTKTVDKAQTYLANAFSSKKAQAHKPIYISYFPTNGKLYVFLSTETITADESDKGIPASGTDQIKSDVFLYVESN